MLPVKELKRLLENIPDEALVVAYEGEVTGISIDYGEINGFINTGGTNWEPGEHRLDQFTVTIRDQPPITKN